jgi:quinol monooxygenase YgiN
VKFLQAIRSLQGRLKQEEGFRKCTVYQEVADGSAFKLIEEWKTQDDLDNYLKSNVFRVLIGALKVLSVEFEVRYRMVSVKQKTKVFEVT